MALARLVAVCDLLLLDSARWLEPPGGRKGAWPPAPPASPSPLAGALRRPAGRARDGWHRRVRRAARGPRARLIHSADPEGERGRHHRAMERPTMLRRVPSRAIVTGDSADVYFARADEILAHEGLDPVVVMEVFTRQEASCAASTRPRSCWRMCSLTRRPRTRCWSRRSMTATPSAPRGRAADPRPLPPLRAVRDRDPGHDGPVHGLGDRRPRVRRRGRARPGHQLRGTARPPGTSPTRSTTPPSWAAAWAPRPRPGRVWQGSAHGHHAPLAGAHLRGHRAGGRGVRPAPRTRMCRASCSWTPSRTRPRRRCASPTRWATGSTASGSTRPRSAGG